MANDEVNCDSSLILPEVERDFVEKVSALSAKV